MDKYVSLLFQMWNLPTSSLISKEISNYVTLALVANWWTPLLKLEMLDVNHTWQYVLFLTTLLIMKYSDYYRVWNEPLRQVPSGDWSFFRCRKKIGCQKVSIKFFLLSKTQKQELSKRSLCTCISTPIWSQQSDSMCKGIKIIM